MNKSWTSAFIHSISPVHARCFQDKIYFKYDKLTDLWADKLTNRTFQILVEMLIIPGKDCHSFIFFRWLILAYYHQSYFSEEILEYGNIDSGMIYCRCDRLVGPWSHIPGLLWLVMLLKTLGIEQDVNGNMALTSNKLGMFTFTPRPNLLWPSVGIWAYLLDLDNNTM